MARTRIATLGQSYVINGSHLHVPRTKSYVLINGTVFQLHMQEPFKDSQLNELLYVIIVIVFYATALMTLIITQIKRQRREGTEVDYYDEYLQRNSEVKRTCQAATTVVTKPPANTQSQRVTAALASAAVAAASAGSIMGATPEEASTSGPTVPKAEREADCVVDIKGSVSLIPGGLSLVGGNAGAGGGVGGGFCRSTEVTVDKEKGYSGVSGPNVPFSSLTPLLSGPSVGTLSPSFGSSRLAYARDRSPTRVLESIPDEGGEE